MNGYKLKRLYIENFKLITKREIDFTLLDLLILDGPNGYGKTTIYDALELLISQKISRIEDNDIEDNRNAHQDSLFAKDKRMSILIKGEFTHEYQNNLVLAIFLPAKENSKIWTNYKCYQLNSYDDDIEKGTLQNNFNDIFGLSQNKIVLADDFKNFYYIQQENNTHFFKQSEKQRIQLLSKFFGTDEAGQLKKDLKGKLKQIKDLQKSINDILTIKKSDLESLNKHAITITNKDAKYISLNIGKLWDKEEFAPNSQEKLKEIHSELESILLLFKYQYLLKSHLSNQEYRSIVNAKNDLKMFIILEHFKDKYEDFKKLIDNESKYKSIKTTISDHNYEEFKKLLLEPLYQELKIDDFTKKLELIETTKDNIDRYIKESGEMSDLARKINEAREDLVKQYKEFEDTTKDDGICPFCGYDGWKTFENLEKEFQKKKAFFEKFKDEKATQATNLKTKLFNETLKELLTSLDAYLGNQENLVSHEFFEQLEQYYDTEKHNIFVAKLKKNVLYDEVLKFANDKEEMVADLDIKLQGIIKIINIKIIEIQDTEFLEQQTKIISAFNIFDKSFENVKKINNEMIKQKQEWLEFQYYTNEEAKKDKLNESILKLDEKLKLLKQLMTSSTKGVVKDLHDKLDKKIKDQWNKVIKQIEIPLYIYSGKILQDTQRGNGIFIDYDTNKQNSPLKFLSTLESDYDATFSMSSGQLSALVVSLTLALNKVYGLSDNGGILLIDDPMQSMDEMNIASFIELIRNDFSNTQMILSTHESKISRLLQYKYLKYDKNVRNYSVKDEFFNESL